MKTFVKKHWKKILLIGALIFIGFKINTTFFTEQPQIKTLLESEVEPFTLADIRQGNLDTVCSVEAISDASIIPEYSGKVTEVYVKDGDQVSIGQKLFAIENINQRVAVQNAKIAVRSAELALSDLLNENNVQNSSSLVSQTENQQKQIVQNAKNALFNNDLRAYPKDNPLDIQKAGPMIEGNYTCENQGEYIVEVYPSNSESGASYIISGLESGRESVSTTAFGTPLGNCGLELRFPESFDNRETWIIPVPNTRSASYTNVLTSYENALAGKNIILNNTQASPQRIAQERARVAQAKLQLESAYSNLAKTIIKAPVSGTLSSFEIKKGDFVTQNSEIGRVKSIDDLELVAYINADELPYIQTGSSAFIDTFETKIKSVSPTVNSLTKKIKVALDAPKDISLVEGIEQSCSIVRLAKKSTVDNINGGKIIPLSALSVIGIDTYVFEISDNIAVKKPVVAGALLGDSIVVYELDSPVIIRDARGIRDGQNIILKNK